MILNRRVIHLLLAAKLIGYSLEDKSFISEAFHYMAKAVNDCHHAASRTTKYSS
jgi:hypothetical protein